MEEGGEAEIGDLELDEGAEEEDGDDLAEDGIGLHVGHKTRGTVALAEKGDGDGGVGGDDGGAEGEAVPGVEGSEAEEGGKRIPEKGEEEDEEEVLADGEG